MPNARIPTELTTGPFTRQRARDLGLTDRQLESSVWRRVFHGVWVLDELEDCLELRLAAARLLLPEHGVVCGVTAAWLHGIDVRRLGDLDLHVGFPRGRRLRSRPGLAVCQETLSATDISQMSGVAVTTPLRTAFDCLRLLRVAERLVVADALTHAGSVTVDELRAYFAEKRRLRNLRIGERLLDFLGAPAGAPVGAPPPGVLFVWGTPPP